MYLDVNGLITQSDGDGGDKLQRTGFWWQGYYFNPAYGLIPGMANYPSALKFLTDMNGNLQRDELKYTAILDPNDVSRDQLIPNINALGLYGYDGFDNRLNTIFVNVIKNYSRYPNKDIAFLGDYGRFFRSFRKWYLYPFIFTFDSWLLLSTIFTTVLTHFDAEDKYVGNDLNLISDLATAKTLSPTPFSFVARKFFKWFRFGDPMYGMRVYFAASTGANVEFISLWQPTVEDF